MSTSGTTAFNLDLNNLVEEAFERCGQELRTGYDLRTARRSLNLLTIEWANRGINLWTIEQGQIPMVTGQALYPVPDSTIDFLDHVIRQNNGVQSTQIDINISRISESTYSTIPNKLTQGRPIQVWYNRQSGMSNVTSATLNGTITSTATTITVSDASYLANAGFIQIDSEIIGYANTSGNQLINCYRGQNGTTAASHTTGAVITNKNIPCINVWPTPDAGGGPYTFVYWRMRRIQDAGGGTSVQDVPFRLVPALVAGLAYHLSVKNPEALDKVQLLKQMYDEAWLTASTEDREKASLRLAPRQLFW